MISLQPGGRISPRTLFAAAILLHGLLFLVLLADSRMPRGQVTGDFLERQRSALAGREAFPAGPAPLLLSVLRPLGPALGSLPFLPLFHVALFVDELMFLVGVWLLARRCWEPPVVAFFVTVAAAGSVLWTDNVYAKFYVIAPVPLALWLIHGFFESQARRNLFLAALLLALQATAAGTLAVLLSVAAWAILSPQDARLRLSALRRRPGDALWLAALALPGGLALARPPLPPAGPRLPGEIADLLLGLSLAPDVTVYCGFFTLALAVHGFARGNRREMLRGAAAALVAFLLLALAGPVLPLVKLAIVFLAGVGLRTLLEDPKGGLGAAIGLLLLAAGLGVLSALCLPGDDAVEQRLRPLLGVSPRWTDTTYPRDPRTLSDLFGAGALASGAAAATLLLFRAGPRTWPLAIALLLLVHSADVYGWKSRMVWFRTTSSVGPLRRIDDPPRRPGASPPSLAGALGSTGASAGSLLWLGLLARQILRESGARRRVGAAP